MTSTDNIQSPPAEDVWRKELDFLATFDDGDKPPGWRLTPRMVIRFLLGSDGQKLKRQGLTSSMAIAEKFVGSRALVERCVITLAGRRGLLLVGEPGTAKSMLSELLAAAISETSALTIQGSAGTTEDHLRYGWNYALLIAKGPHPEALVPSPVMTAMRQGGIVRVEEITRCLPEVQDALISILSERLVSIPELGDSEAARAGFNVIATANLRDRGTSDMSSALKRRFNFEVIEPIPDLKREVALVRKQAEHAMVTTGQPDVQPVDEAVIEALVTVFRDLRRGQTDEGWPVEKPSTVMSTAEAVAVASSLGVAQHYLGDDHDSASLVPEYLLGVVLKDEPKDRGRLLAYWDGPIAKRAGAGKARMWKRLYELRGLLGG